jgi:hypothetical protein
MNRAEPEYQIGWGKFLVWFIIILTYKYIFEKLVRQMPTPGFAAPPLDMNKYEKIYGGNETFFQ